MDPTIEVEAVEAVDGVSPCTIGSLDGGSSSISDTSSREVVDMRRWLRGDLAGGKPPSFTDPLAVVAGVIDCWLWRLFVVVGEVTEAESEPWASCWEL